MTFKFFTFIQVGKNCTPAEKSFGVGSTAECLESLAGHLNNYVEPLLTMFLGMTKDEDEDVRNNAVYGAGELALHGGQVHELPVHTGFLRQKMSILKFTKIHWESKYQTCLVFKWYQGANCQVQGVT